MRTKLNGILTLFLALIVQVSFAQEKAVSGTVTDQDGLPLPGTSVVVKGTTTGTQTDFDGNYAINTEVVLFWSFPTSGKEPKRLPWEVPTPLMCKWWKTPKPLKK